jgi:hypothetical protein
MLKGFKEGYSHSQVMCLTVFFKKYGYELEQIIDILTITESINGNSWNNWNIEDKVNYFYDYNGVPDVDTLIKEFGDIFFICKGENIGYKIPFSVGGSGEIKTYLYLLKNGPCRKKDILNNLQISNNKLDRQLEKTVLFEKRNNLYCPINVISSNYIYISEEELNKLLELKQNDIVVYLYLKWRCGENKEIQTSIQSIEKITLLSHSTISCSIKNLELKDILIVKRNPNNYKKFISENRESNIYKLKEL